MWQRNGVAVKMRISVRRFGLPVRGIVKIGVRASVLCWPADQIEELNGVYAGSACGMIE